MVMNKNTRYTGIPYIDMYKGGNWKWLIPIQITLFLLFILMFKLEM